MFTLIIEDKHGGIADEYSFEEGEFYIGRSHTSDIILPSDNVSRRHARLYTVDGKCYIEDLSSSNGVFVNGRRINEVYQIQRSAQIKVGDYYLHIESDTEAGVEEEKTWCKLTGRNLAFANQVFRVQRKVNLIGRGKDCTLTIIDPSVSRIHTKLSVERSGALTIEDLKSSNGTFLNDERIEVATVNHRDIIRFGNVEFLVEIPEQESSAKSTKSESPKEARREKARQEEREAPKAEAARPAAARPAAARPAAATSAPKKEKEEKRPTYEDLWEPEKKKVSWVVWVSALLFVVGVAVVLLVVFKEQIFGGGAVVPETLATTAPPAPEAPKGPSPEEVARQAAEDKKKKEDELTQILDVAKDHLRGRRWEQARERYARVLELDPLNEVAQRAVNQIKQMEADKNRLEEARRLRDALKRGEAATLLREIGDTSVYYGEARDELTKLAEAKTTLMLTVNSLVRDRDCQGALNTLKELQLIDPKDAVTSAKVEEVQALSGTKKCAN